MPELRRGVALERPADSRDWLIEAARPARRSGETDTTGMFFGPTNVDIWRVLLDRSRRQAGGTEERALY